MTFGIPKVLSIVPHDPGYANLPSITYSDQGDRAMALSSQYNVCHPNPLIQVFYYCPNVRAVQAYLPWTFSTVISQRFMLLEKKTSSILCDHGRTGPTDLPSTQMSEQFPRFGHVRKPLRSFIQISHHIQSISL